MDKIPLTIEELRLWTEWKLNPTRCNYTLSLQYELIGALAIKRLNSALTIAQNFFDRLRTSFVEEAGVPYRIICLGYSVNIRPKHEYAKLLFGFFVNELGLRTQLSGELTFREILSTIIEQRISDKKYQDYPLIERLLKRRRIDNARLKFPFNVGLVKTSFFCACYHIG